MKMAYVLKCFPRLSETFILTEVLELERLGWDVTIFTRIATDQPVPHAALRSLRAEVIDLAGLLRERLWEPFEIHRHLAARLGRLHDDALGAALELRSRDEIRAWLLAGVVAERALAHPFDLIHAHFATSSASIARYASLLTSTPFTFTAHAKDIYAQEVDHRRLRLLQEQAEVVVTISESNREFLQALAPRARLRRVYNGLDLKRFPALGRPPAPRPPRLLFVGRMVEKKGIANLIDACALLRERDFPVQCRLVGSGPLEQVLREQVRRLDLEAIVEFREPASQEEVATVHLPEASIFVLPCVIALDGDRDGLPTTLLEAMACGVPVISTRLSGIPEAVPDGEAGLLVEPGDAPGLADAIVRTLNDSSGTRRRSRWARQHVERLFDTRNNVGQLSEIFRSAALSRVNVGARGLR